MRILDLAIKDIRQILRERQSFFFLLIMPVVFTLLFGFAFGGFGGGEAGDPRLPVGLINEDDGRAAAALTDLLASSQLIAVITSDSDVAALDQQVSDGELAAGIIVPAGYSTALASNAPLPLQVATNPGGNSNFTIEGEINAAARRLQSAWQAAQVSTETAVAAGYLHTAAETDAYFNTALDAGISAWAAPPLQVHTEAASASVDGGDETAVYSDNAFAHSSPGMMAQFATAGLITAAQILVLERKNGALRRLLTTNMHRFSILLGHYLAMFLLILIQLVVLVLFGQLLLDLPYLTKPLATVVMILSTSLFAASLGLLIGALAQSEEQAIVFTLVPMFVLAGLGGAWVPLEFTPPTVQQIAYFTPMAWMMDGFKDIIVRGLGVTAVLPGAGILLLYALAFWALAAWRFKFE